MKRSHYLVIVAALFASLIFSGCSPQQSEAEYAGTIKTHFFKTKNLKYPQIKGLANKNAQTKINTALRKYAEIVYQQQNRLVKQYKLDKTQNKSIKPYFKKLTYKVVYHTHGKLSILTTNSGYAGDADGFLYIKGFNFDTNTGQSRSLRSNFSSFEQYKKANAYALNYMKDRKKSYPFASNSTFIYGHTYFWTNQGLTVVFQVYKVRPYAYGPAYIPIPKSYLK
ncbi:PdaC/SigV domain-containing protein [Sporolactobacillus kofuensis]|uniref:PdaC/SigV domain-containing protein n=1 Tax=Sporolactobacillus kofuensis TaxID=269672 RepID=A0ABW1WE23_9BACL|nr:DUF4163 domain-containing protein [Sporolactobacillus kofuensis]MCO7174774.1 DUF3298 and DUF4163 domain-containing protein [Sporolactobacillus kofuensis]